MTSETLRNIEIADGLAKGLLRNRFAQNLCNLINLNGREGLTIANAFTLVTLSKRSFQAFQAPMGRCSLGPDAHTLPFTSNELNLDGSPDLELLESLRDFTRVSSDFYPDLALHYSKVIDDWHSVRKREIQSSTGPSA